MPEISQFIPARLEAARTQRSKSLGASCTRQYDICSGEGVARGEDEEESRRQRGEALCIKSQFDSCHPVLSCPARIQGFRSWSHLFLTSQVKRKRRGKVSRGISFPRLGTRCEKFHIRICCVLVWLYEQHPPPVIDLLKGVWVFGDY